MALDEKIISYTENPSRELLSVASRTNIALNELDFHLLAFSTQYRLENTEWIKIAEKDLTLFEKDEVFLKEDLQIKQEYKIEIFHQTRQDKTANAIKLIANKNLTKIVAQINFNELKYHEKLAFELLQNIYKKMLKLKFLIGIRIFDFKKELIRICNEHKKNTLNKTLQINVAKGVEPIQSQDEALVLLYKEKAKDYTIDEKRSGIIAVDENEVVLRYNKFKQGKEGKDLNLHTLKVIDANQNKIKFNCSSLAFKAVEYEDYTEYLALKKGYVVEDQDKFDIANLLEFNNKVDFKNIGIIRAGLDKNVKINIKFISDMQDAVNSGVGIECEELNITGSVGSNTNLKATRMRVEGTTHTKSKIYAKEAYIKTHRGFAQADKLNIDLLEGGNIKAKEVRIKKSLGGVIEADRIYIEQLESNNSCVFYNNVVIERFEGKNNKFHTKIKKMDKDYDQELLKIKNEISSLHHKISKLKQYILSNKNNVLDIEKKVLELKNQGQNIPSQYEKFLKNFSIQNANLNKLQNQEKELLEYRKKIHDELLALEEDLFKAKFINKSGKWSDMNEIRFSLLEPKEDIFYSSSTKESAKFIALKKIIQNNQEYIEIDKKLDYEEKDIEWLLPSKE
ncbi:flagellar assembly protein A [Campylobacter coli]|uniref:flagellar assembly protein A n=1 Tax=Campylobacter coli TaxID=195 RepID=UPI0037520AC4